MLSERSLGAEGILMLLVSWMFFTAENARLGADDIVLCGGGAGRGVVNNKS